MQRPLQLHPSRLFHQKPENREIANGRYHAKQLADGAAMLCEVSGAVNSMIRRWESVFRDYPDLLTDAGNRAVVKRTIQKVKDYLQRLEDTI